MSKKQKVFLGISACILGLIGSAPSSVQAQTSSFTFGAAGDLGSTSNNNTAASFTTLATSGVQFFLAAGDMSYMNPGTETAWCDYVKSKVGVSFPFQIVSGNHEGDGLNGLIDNFASCLPNKMNTMVTGSSPTGMSPSYTSSYGKEYYFDYPYVSPLARFIMISPDITLTNGGKYEYLVGNSHYTWLSNVIDAARAQGIKWIVVGMHKNCITAGVKPCEIKIDLMNLLINKRVDLILQGHEHDYQRSKQLTCAAMNSYNPGCIADDGTDDSYVKGAGPIIVIDGTFGAGQVNINIGDTEAAYFAKFEGANVNQTYGFMKYTITENQLSAQFIRSTGGNFTDNFVITGAGSSQSPTQNPTNTSIIVPSVTNTATPGACNISLEPTIPSVMNTVSLPAGTYAVWSRILSPGSIANSYWLVIGNMCPIAVGDLSTGTGWEWINYSNGSASNTISFTSNGSSYPIMIAQKESNVAVDTILFTQDTSCRPEGLGTNCSGITVTQSIKPGDANSDGRVNGQDYVIWLLNYQTQTTNGPSKGDFNNDGIVNGVDYIIWLNNYTV